MSLALQFSIISAPARRVTMATNGTPIAAASDARRRRDTDAAPSRHQTGDAPGRRLVDRSLQARTSSSGSLNGAPPPAGALPSIRPRLKSSTTLKGLRVRLTEGFPVPPGRARPARPADPARRRPAGLPRETIPAVFHYQAGTGRCARHHSTDPTSTRCSGESQRPLSTARWASARPESADLTSTTANQPGRRQSTTDRRPRGYRTSSSAMGSKPCRISCA